MERVKNFAGQNTGRDHEKGLIYSNDKQQNFCNDVITTTKIQTDINCQNRKYHKMLVYMLINFRMVFVLFFHTSFILPRQRDCSLVYLV